MKRVVAALTVLAMSLAVFATGCALKSTNLQAFVADTPAQESSVVSPALLPTPVGSVLGARRASVPEESSGIKGTLGFSSELNRTTNGVAFNDRWRLEQELLEQNIGQYKAWTVVLKATNISGQPNHPYDACSVNLIFRDSAGKEIISDASFIGLIGKLDLERNQVGETEPGRTLVFEPFFWIPADMLEKATDYTIGINLRTSQQDYLPNGTFASQSGVFKDAFVARSGIYKETTSSKGKMIVGHKTNTFGDKVSIQLRFLSPPSIIHGQLLFNWLDDSGKSVEEIKEGIYQPRSSGSGGDRKSFEFNILSARQHKIIKSYEFCFEIVN